MFVINVVLFQIDNNKSEMAQYFRWMKDKNNTTTSGSRSEEEYLKPRSKSLDAKSLEASGIRLVLQNVRHFLYFNLVSYAQKQI